MGKAVGDARCVFDGSRPSIRQDQVERRAFDGVLPPTGRSMLSYGHGALLLEPTLFVSLRSLASRSIDRAIQAGEGRG